MRYGCISWLDALHPPHDAGANKWVEVEMEVEAGDERCVNIGQVWLVLYRETSLLLGAAQGEA